MVMMNPRPVLQLDGGPSFIDDEEVKMDTALRTGLQSYLRIGSVPMYQPCQRVLEVRLGVKDRSLDGEARHEVMHVHHGRPMLPRRPGNSGGRRRSPRTSDMPKPVTATC